MSVRKIHFTNEAPSGDAPVEQVHADNLPGGGASSLADGSVTGAKLADGTVTADKIARGVIPAAYTLPAAGSAIGGVKRAAAVADAAEGADAAALRTTVNALLASLRASGALAS